MDGKPVAYAGDKLTCGATIQPQQSHVVGDSGSYYNGSTNFSQNLLDSQKGIFDEQIQVEVNNSFSDLFLGLAYRLKVDGNDPFFYFFEITFLSLSVSLYWLNVPRSL